jgi:hypothetical protein
MVTMSDAVATHVAPQVAPWTGWLLRVNRLFGPDERWARLAAFAAAFPGNGWARTVSESSISRWETALIRIPGTAVRRYEQLLGTAPYLLVSTIDTVRRYFDPVGVPAPPRPMPPDDAQEAALERIQEALDTVLAEGPVTGGDWDELTGLLAAVPYPVLLPRSTWTELAGRLLGEMIVADGVPWLRRFEALNRLLVHPSSRRAAIDVCASLAADPRQQVPVELICALDGTDHPDASRHVLAQLTHPTNDRTFYGALLACVRKVRYGHFTPAERQRLLAVVTDTLAGGAYHPDGTPLAAELLRTAAPGELTRSRRAWLERVLGSDPVLAQVLEHGRLAGDAAATGTVQRVTRTALGALTREVPGYREEVLPGLLDLVITSPVADVRLYLSMLIAASPYRQPTARALAAELARMRLPDRPGLAGVLLGALRIVGGPAQRPLVERLIVAPGLPAPVAVAAAHAIGHVGGASAAGFWRGAIALHAGRWHRHRDRASAAVLQSLVYGLGMSRDLPLLGAVRDDDRLPPPVRAAAAWWLDIPDRTFRGAQR